MTQAEPTMRQTAPNSSRHARRAASAATALLCAVVVFGGGLAASTPAAAQAPLQMMQESGGVSLSEATRMVRERTGGQVLRAETKRDKGRTVHRIRVLTEDGRVRNWNVDAETGRMY
jgi:uncharacterized membrane protein YkoI